MYESILAMPCVGHRHRRNSNLVDNDSCLNEHADHFGPVLMFSYRVSSEVTDNERHQRLYESAAVVRGEDRSYEGELGRRA